jgi:hypothetical protein
MSSILPGAPVPAPSAPPLVSLEQIQQEIEILISVEEGIVDPASAKGEALKILDALVGSKFVLSTTKALVDNLEKHFPGSWL